MLQLKSLRSESRYSEPEAVKEWVLLNYCCNPKFTVAPTTSRTAGGVAGEINANGHRRRVEETIKQQCHEIIENKLPLESLRLPELSAQPAEARTDSRTSSQVATRRDM